MFYNPTAARRMVCYCLLTVFIFILAGCSNKNTHKQSNDSIEMNTQEDNNLEESNESSSNDDSELEHNTAMHDLSIMAINLEDTDCTFCQFHL